MKLFITTLTMIFISFGSNANKLDKDQCDKIFNKVSDVLDVLNYMERQQKELDKYEIEAVQNYNKLLNQWSTIYSAFCKD
jgi:hypothetical protein